MVEISWLAVTCGISSLSVSLSRDSLSRIRQPITSPNRPEPGNGGEDDEEGGRLEEGSVASLFGRVEEV